MRLLKTLIVAALVALILPGCSTSKKLTYMQDLVAGEILPFPEPPEIEVRAGDRLGIVVSCKNPQLALPFNMNAGVFSLEEGSNGMETSRMGASADRGYLVDANGNIEFPVLGVLEVGGKTLTQVKKLVTKLIVDNNYIKDPIVTVDFLNFKYTILGEVSKKGNLEVTDNHINLLQAIANAGDLSTAANYKDVKVIRTRNGYREVYSVNMFSKELYNSPAFNIQQDDVIYIKPRASKWSQDGNIALTLTTTTLTVISVLSNIILWIYVYGKQ